MGCVVGSPGQGEEEILERGDTRRGGDIREGRDKERRRY